MKDVEGYEGLYAVTRWGGVWSYRSNKWLKLNLLKRGKGYLVAQLWKNNKQKCFYIHQLVARAYIANPGHKPTVNHKDGDTRHNRKRNLEWMTVPENNAHAWATGLIDNNGENCGTSKLTQEDIDSIINLVRTKTQREVAEQFNINQSHVSRIVNKHRWRGNQYVHDTGRGRKAS